MIFREKLWDVVEVDTNKARRLAEELRLSPLVTSVLLGRGIDNADAMREFLFGNPNPYHDPFLMADMDIVNSSDENRKLFNLFTANNLSNYEVCDIVGNSECTLDNRIITFSSASTEILRSVVNYVNTGFETKKDEEISIADYLIPQTEWWKRKSANYIEIPFGVSDTKKVQNLQISQENGRNSAIVIGIPGSGKSVFLHSLILNASINYSPDELNLYLIDFSGVEFNSYAIHNLPHARVIAPEAEREFGLSILRELVEEGSRRMSLCRDNDVSNIVDLKCKKPELSIPRLLVIIDEFQKFFEIENDAISREANIKINTIIQEFRKFGINLILATQRLPSSSILPKDLIANRIVFRSQPSDFSTLISWQSNVRYPQLSTGECIYNSDSGSPYDNNKVKSFFVSKKNIDDILTSMRTFALAEYCGKQPQLTVFRSNELPEVSQMRKRPEHSEISEYPDEVGIYIGESIAISEYDVCATLQRESNNNILIIGGDSNVAQKIAINASLSAIDAHADKTAAFYLFNYMRSSDPLYELPTTYFTGIPFETKMSIRTTDVLESLSEIKRIIEERKTNEDVAYFNIYLLHFAFQLGKMFERGGRRGDDLSEAGTLLDYILKNGPAVGVFNILQVDNLENLNRISAGLFAFQHKIALQMEENDSNRIIGTSEANRLYVMNRPSSKFRGYYCDKSRNILIKFKPYK